MWRRLGRWAWIAGPLMLAAVLLARSNAGAAETTRLFFPVLAQDPALVARLAPVWPQAGRDAANTRSTPFDGPTTPIVRWFLYAGPARPTVLAASDGAIYVGAFWAVYLFDRSANIRWRLDFPTELRTGSPPALALGPTGILYVALNGLIYGVDPVGTIRLTIPARTTAESTLVVGPGDRLFVSEPGRLRALELDGRPIWDLHHGAPFASQPVVSDSGTAYLATAGDAPHPRLLAITADGSPRWSYALTGPPPLFGAPAPPSLGPDGTIYVPDTDGTLHALRLDGVEAWTIRIATVPLRWSPAVAADQTLVVGGPTGVLQALSPAGRTAWHDAVGGNVLASGATVGANGTAYIGADDGYLYAVEPGGRRRWRFALGAVVESPPIVGPGRSIAATSTDGYLFVLGDRIGSGSTARDRVVRLSER